MPQLSYAVIDDDTLRRFRTGHVLSDILRVRPDSDLRLAAARMFHATPGLMADFTRTFKGERKPKGTHPGIYSRFDRYLSEEYSEENQPKRILLLVFQGESAIDNILEIVGSPRGTPNMDGTTIRGTFGGFATDKRGRVTYFEPVVFIPNDQKTSARGIGLFRDFAQEHPQGALDDIFDWNNEIEKIRMSGLLEKFQTKIYERTGIEPEYQKLQSNVQTSLLMVKPPVNGIHPHFPGLFLQYLAGLGRNIVGVHYFHMSVGDFHRFYGHLQDGALKEKPEEFDGMCRMYTGYPPASPESLLKPDPHHACLAFVYQGPYMVPIIRNVIGPTNPAKWGPGQIRHDFGKDIQMNAVHGTDDPANYPKERDIIGINGPQFSNTLQDLLK